MADAARNALAGERSPFLQHGAIQPVNWQPWGEEAFARAQREDRPILLDIGAVWCHWCHVMDRESYDDEATAALINDHFVAIKVDRDERPDVDARYQRAVQLMTGQGGWPLTAFLTPTGDVFYGGTYFPPRDQHGRPSLSRVLTELARLWRDERDRAVESVNAIRDNLVRVAEAESAPGELDPSLLEHTIEELAAAFDFRHGGFGRAPKFPNAGALDLLLDHAIDDDVEWARRIVIETTHAMARGGIYDQLGGGFHRYATDARWLIPHFEKMAYDNGTLLATYARAGAVFDDPVLRAAATGIVDHYADVAPTLRAAGGFPASQDADFGDDNDGDYWTWTVAELRAALDGDERRVTAAVHYYGLDDAASSMHLDPERHVLHQASSAAALARVMGEDEADTRRLLEQIRIALKRTRDARPRPFIDETLYSGWVALVASGHLAAARYLGHDDAGAAALRALERIFADAWRDGAGVLHRAGDPASDTLLEDQAHVLLACIDAFEVAHDETWRARARSIAQLLLDRFRDDASGAFRDRPADAAAPVATLHEPLLPIADAPAPSGNASAALGLLRLHALTQDSPWADAAHAVLRAFAGSACRLGAAAATYAKALSWALLPVTNVVIVDDGSQAGAALLDAARRTYRPRTVLQRLRADHIQHDTLPAELRAMIDAQAPRAYICAGRTCAAPLTAPDALIDMLHTLRG